MALEQPDIAVRQAAIHSVSLLRDQDALDPLIKLLSSDSLTERRSSAEAIGRLRNWRGVAPLFRALSELPAAPTTSGDRVFEHSLIYALIEIANPKATVEGLKSESSAVQRAALVALDQMSNGGLTAQAVTPLLSASDAELRRTAGWIVGRHPEWADTLADYLATRLKDERLSADERSVLANQLGGFAQSLKIQKLLASRLSDTTASAAEREIVLQAMGHASLKEVPGHWSEALAKVIDADDRSLVIEAIGAIRSMSHGKTPAPELGRALIAWAARPELDDAQRLQALTAVPGGLQSVPTATFDLLERHLRPDTSESDRAAAVDVLAKAKLSPDQLISLAAKLPLVGPLEIDRMLAAFEKATDTNVGLKLVSALAEPGVMAALRVETLKPHLQKYPAAVQIEAEKLYAQLSAALAGQRAKLDELAESLPPGDVRRGQANVNITKAACVTCHAIGYVGGRVGPDLTRIGQVRQQRDLLESIVFPSASFVRSYEPVTVVTADGLTHNGLLRKDAADEVVLVKSPTEEIRIARDNVEEMLPGAVSIMPQGLDKQLSTQDLADLVAFLQGCR
jgi:putative heme-binding domain-containing protein